MAGNPVGSVKDQRSRADDLAQRAQDKGVVGASQDDGFNFRYIQCFKLVTQIIKSFLAAGLAFLDEFHQSRTA
ncbi:hypothetical protein SDC9_169550 [bioreactor metagenome]|uniref:Uncharacterized protein n=1 Tax=bioreactor metagenome TaxID=1076179 RepID=A0A645G5H7_9ZZZZ